MHIREKIVLEKINKIKKTQEKQNAIMFAIVLAIIFAIAFS